MYVSVIKEQSVFNRQNQLVKCDESYMSIIYSTGVEIFWKKKYCF